MKEQDTAKQNIKGASKEGKDKVIAKPKQKAAGKGFVLFISFVLLSIVGATFAFAYYWYQPKINSFSKQIKVLNSQVSAMEQSEKQRQTFSHDLTAQLTQTEGALNQSNNNIKRLRQQTEGAINSLQQQVFRNQQNWLYADIYYLLKIANRRVNLAADAQGAIAALQLADTEIEKINNSALVELRESIFNTIKKLNTLQEPDIEALVKKLDDIQAQLLVLILEKPKPFKKGKVELENIMFSGSFEEFMGQFFTIKPSTSAIKKRAAKENNQGVKVQVSDLVLIAKAKQAVLTMDQAKFDLYMEKLIAQVKSDKLRTALQVLQIQKVTIEIANAGEPLKIYKQFLSTRQEEIKGNNK